MAVIVLMSWSGLQALIAASLVQVDERPDGERRFRMLETVREFGMEQLASHGELNEVSRRHADYFLALAEGGAGHLAAPLGENGVTRLGTEQPNIRAALGPGCGIAGRVLPASD